MNIALISQFADLAAIYQDLGCYDDAEKVLRQIIAIKQAALPQDDVSRVSAALPNVIINLNNLAFVYGAQGKFKATGELFERVLAIAEAAVGDNDIIVTPALKNLAGNYRARGENEKSRTLLDRARKIEKTAADNFPVNWIRRKPEPEHKLVPVSESIIKITTLQQLLDTEPEQILPE